MNFDHKAREYAVAVLSAPSIHAPGMLQTRLIQFFYNAMYEAYEAGKRDAAIGTKA